METTTNTNPLDLVQVSFADAILQANGQFLGPDDIAELGRKVAPAVEDLISERNVLRASTDAMAALIARLEQGAALAPVTDVMIDIETMGKRPGCAVRSIGACAFDLATGATWRHFKVNVTASSCKLARLHEDPDTIAWWEKQSPEARAALDVDPVDIWSALQRLVAMLPDWAPVRVWCWGLSFDVPILDEAFRLVRMIDPAYPAPPWDFRALRCARTICGMVNVRPDRSGGTHHDALDDCIAQAKAVAQAMAVIRNGGGGMIPVNFEGATRILGAPADWNETTNGPCVGLPILDLDGTMVSMWEPTPEEVEAIGKGAPVGLRVVGTAHPPVQLFVVDPAAITDQRPAASTDALMAASLLGTVADIRQATGLGDRPMLSELPGAIRDLLAGKDAEIERLLAALEEARQGFQVLQTLNSHGASDRSYIGMLRSNAKGCEDKVRAALAAHAGGDALVRGLDGEPIDTRTLADPVEVQGLKGGAS